MTPHERNTHGAVPAEPQRLFQPAFVVLGTLAVLFLAVGLLTQLATPPLGHRSFTFHPRALRYVVIVVSALVLCAALTMLFLRMRGMTKLNVLLPAVLVVILVLLNLAVFVFASRRGVHRWVHVSAYGFQPGEVAKLAFPLVSMYLVDRNATRRYFPYLWFGSLVLLACLLLRQRDLSTLLLILACTMLCIPLVASRALVLWVALCAVLFLTASLAVDAKARSRLALFLRGHSGTSAGLTQSELALHAIKRAGPLGPGARGMTVGYSTIPLAVNDFAFAQFASVYGAIPALLLIACCWLWTDELAYISSTSEACSRVVFPCAAYVGLSAALHILSNLGMVPTGDIPLPCVSLAGTSLLCGLFAIVLPLAWICRAETIPAVRTTAPRYHGLFRVAMASLFAAGTVRLLWLAFL